MLFECNGGRWLFFGLININNNKRFNLIFILMLITSATE